ncbi:MAG TPA: thiamine pyrophosphate-requiring protein [Stellaceae bacterium]|nr:thiamine pyrophosphate-requiring protein [Stellaceae bacterium]
MDAERDLAPEPGESTAAELFLRALHAHGIDYFLANPGTDFPPVIEAFARARKSGVPVPRPMVIPHENTAVSMAHGVYMLTGRPQAVMVHVSVGTGNTLNALINASRDHIPLLLIAGRTPLTEGRRHGSRDRYIHWAQEMFDQGALVRELVKWDHELRTPEQAADAVARAMELMMASPRGPAYLMLPREVIGAAARIGNAPLARRAVPATPHPDPAGVEALARAILRAERPLVIASNSGEQPAGVAALARLAERAALPVVEQNPRFLCLPSSHAMHQGYQPGPLLKEADLVLVIEADVPWIPAQESPPEECPVAHIGPDPSFARYPMRSYRSDFAIAGDTATILGALEAQLAALAPAEIARIATRRERLTRRHRELREKWAAESAAAEKAEAITPPWLGRCLREAIGEDAVVVNEYPLKLEYCPRERPRSYFGLSPAGGLGWGFGAALGAKLAAPDRLVVATLGDGAYMFANPTACHWTSAKYDLPILTVIFNNERYGAVRRATLSMYGEGAAAEDDGRLLADLSPSPAFEKLVEASGGYGERVVLPADLPAALARALRAVREEKRQALLNVICRY